jgi:hypothetical protein
VLLLEVLLDTYTVEAVVPVSRVAKLATKRHIATCFIIMMFAKQLARQTLKQIAIVWIGISRYQPSLSLDSTNEQLLATKEANHPVEAYMQVFAVVSHCRTTRDLLLQACVVRSASKQHYEYVLAVFCCTYWANGSKLQLLLCLRRWTSQPSVQFSCK